MGDRGNIGIVQHQNGHDADGVSVFLYTHWGGWSVRFRLADALDSPEGRNRWGDEPYLTRIIFDRLTGGDRGETGFGISTYICDNEYPIPLVDCVSKTVAMLDRNGIPTDGPPLSFEDFILAARKEEVDA